MPSWQRWKSCWRVEAIRCSGSCREPAHPSSHPARCRDPAAGGWAPRFTPPANQECEGVRGRQKFLEVVKGIDPQVLVVIPVTPSNSMFLISLTKGANRKFITVPEDDIIDLPNEAGILTKITKTVKDAVAAL